MKNLKNLAKEIRNMSHSRRLDGDAVENYNMSIKSTPTKDARKTAELSIMCNHMLKRNEQGVWQKRLNALLFVLFK